MQQKNYEVDVLVNGRPIKEYFHEGKTYVEGKKGTEFSLKLKNNSWSRKLFIVSIDGLSVIDGKDASFDSGGYIVPPHSSMTIDGWRVSDKEVAKFYFSKEKDSYRVKKGDGKNLGVIGMAVFEEKTKSWFPTTICNEPLEPIKWKPFYDSGTVTFTDPTGGHGSVRLNASSHESENASAFYCSSSMNYMSGDAKQELGTGWGNYKNSEVVSVDFERLSKPDAVFEIFYNTKEQLEKMGVQFKTPMYLAPQAFPGRYCEPPKN